MADIDGGPGNDDLLGTALADDIEPMQGNDTVRAGGGDDDVQGAQGNDVLYGEEGNDDLVDAFNGSPGLTENDKLYGGAGDDSLSSYQASHFDDIDELRGDEGNDFIIFNGAQTGDVADGGPGTDTFSGSFSSGAAGAIRAVFSAGGFGVFVNDTATVTATGFEQIVMVTGSGDDLLVGSPLDDDLLSTGGLDTLQGLDGNDTIGFVAFGEVPLLDGLVMDGGPGTDSLQLLFRLVPGNYVFDVSTGAYSRGATPLGISNFEMLFADFDEAQANVRLVGGGFRDSLITGVGNDTVIGGGGDDYIGAPFADNAAPGGTKMIDAGDGDDQIALARFGTSTVEGGAGLDTVIIEQSNMQWALDPQGRLASTQGDEGAIVATGIELFQFSNDIFTSAEVGLGGGIAGTAGDDPLVGTAGRDVLSGLAGNDTLEGGAGADFLAGGAGVDLVSGASAGGLVFIDMNNNVSGTTYFFDGTDFDLLTGIEGAVGGSTGDFLLGNSQANRFLGNAGVDAILGRNGRDTLEGGDGDDLLMGGSSYDPAERIENVPNDDSIGGGAGSDIIFGQDGRDTIDGGDGADYVLGGTGVQFTVTGVFEDRINGGGGDDFLFGGTAFAFNQANAGPDDFAGGDGLDFIVGGQAGDRLRGDGGNDLVYAGSGNDLINNGTGIDLATAGAGDDSLFGEDGNDTIAGGSGFDYIYGGAGADTFILNRGDSFDSIFDWSAAEGDKVKLEASLGLSGFADFSSRLTGFSFEGVDYTVLALAFDLGGVPQFDQFTFKGIRPQDWTEAMLA